MLKRVGGRTRRRGPRRLTDWIKAANGSATEVNLEAVGGASTFMLDETDLDSHNDRMTVIRIVGDYIVTGRITGGCPRVIIGTGIYKSLLDSSGDPVILNPFLDQDADNESWLTKKFWATDNRYSSMSGQTTSCDMQAHFTYDVRVARRLEGRECVILTAVAQGMTNCTFATATETFALRALVKLS